MNRPVCYLLFFSSRFSRYVFWSNVSNVISSQIFRISICQPRIHTPTQWSIHQWERNLRSFNLHFQFVLTAPGDFLNAVSRWVEDVLKTRNDIQFSFHLPFDISTLYRFKQIKLETTEYCQIRTGESFIRLNNTKCSNSLPGGAFGISFALQFDRFEK